MQKSQQSEPPSTQAVQAGTHFLVGRDSRGHWVVQDECGLRGGLFIDRNKALRYAMDESGRRPQAIRMIAGIIELDMSGRAPIDPEPSSSQPPDFDVAPPRRAA
jgi:hypothetical protein